MNVVGITSDQGLQDVDLNNYSYCNDNACVSESQSKIDNQDVGHSDDSEYTLATDKLYKIWFNSDPDHFLSEKNKLRLEELRIDNPNAQLSLVCRGELMSLAIRKEVNEFLDIYRINLVDFDVILQEALNNPNFPETELKLLMLAKEELDNLGNKGNSGGNFAAASDILRFCPSIAQFGIYSDFDVNLKFNDITPSFGISSPIIIPQTNNDFVAFAKSCDGPNIHQNALKEIYKIQNVILNNYQAYDSITGYRAQIKNKNIYDELEWIFKEHEKILADDYSNIDRASLVRNLESLESARALSVSEAEGLLCDIQDDLMYLLLKDVSKLRSEALHSIFESIRNNMSDYEIAEQIRRLQAEINDLKRQSSGYRY